MALALVDVVWLAARNDGSALVGINSITIVVLLLVVASAFAMLSFAAKRLGRPLRVVSDFVDSAVYLFVFVAFLSPFTSLMASLDFPLLDDVFERADLWLGFDWSGASAWVAHHRLVDITLNLAYFSMRWQAPFILVIGSFARQGERNAEALWLFVTSVFICVTVAGFLPAYGHLSAMGVVPMDELLAIREGHWTIMSVSGGGIVSFPSFHASLAVIFIYCVRRYRWALAVFTPLNVIMLASTPTVGGHYVIDVISGIAVAAAAIILVRHFQSRYSEHITPT